MARMGVDVLAHREGLRVSLLTASVQLRARKRRNQRVAQKKPRRRSAKHSADSEAPFAFDAISMSMYRTMAIIQHDRG